MRVGLKSGGVVHAEECNDYHPYDEWTVFWKKEIIKVDRGFLANIILGRTHIKITEILRVNNKEIEYIKP